MLLNRYELFGKRKPGKTSREGQPGGGGVPPLPSSEGSGDSGVDGNQAAAAETKDSGAGSGSGLVLGDSMTSSSNINNAADGREKDKDNNSNINSNCNSSSIIENSSGRGGVVEEDRGPSSSLSLFESKVRQIEETSAYLMLPQWESGELVKTVRSKPSTIDQILVIVKEYRRNVDKLETLITMKNKLQVNVLQLASGGLTDPEISHKIYEDVNKTTKLSLQCLYTYCCIRRLESTPRVYFISENVTIFDYLSHDARLMFEFVRRIDFYEDQEGFLEFVDEMYFLMLLGGNLQTYSNSILKYNSNYFAKKAEFGGTVDRILLLENRVIDCSRTIAAAEEVRQCRVRAAIEEEERGREQVKLDAAKCRTEKEKDLKLRKYNDESTRKRSQNPDFLPYNYSAVLRLPYKTGLLYPAEMQWYHEKPNTVVEATEGKVEGKSESTEGKVEGNLVSTEGKVEVEAVAAAEYYGVAEQRFRTMYQSWKTPGGGFAFLSKAEHEAEIKRKIDEAEAERQRIIDLEEAERQRIIDDANEERRLAELEAKRIRDEIIAERARLEAIEEQHRAEAKRKADEKRKADREADNRQIYRSRRADFEVRRKEFGLQERSHSGFGVGGGDSSSSTALRDDYDLYPERERPKTSPAGHHSNPRGQSFEQDEEEDRQNIEFGKSTSHAATTLYVVDHEAERKKLRLEVEMEVRKKLELEAEKKREAALAEQVKRMEEIQIEVRKRAEIEAYDKVKEELEREYRKKRELEEEKVRKDILDTEKKKQALIDAEKMRVAQLESQLKLHMEMEALNAKKREIETTNRKKEEAARREAERVRLLQLEIERLRLADLEVEAQRKADIESGLIEVDPDEEAKRLASKAEDLIEKANIAADAIKQQADMRMDEEGLRLASIEEDSIINAEFDRLNALKEAQDIEDRRIAAEAAEVQRQLDLEMEARRQEDAAAIEIMKIELESLTKLKDEMDEKIKIQAKMESEIKQRMDEMEAKRQADMMINNKVDTYVTAASRFSNKSYYARTSTPSKTFNAGAVDMFVSSLSHTPILDSTEVKIAEHALQDDDNRSSGKAISRLYHKNKGNTFNSVPDTIIQKNFDYAPLGSQSQFAQSVQYMDPFLNTTLTNINMKSKSPLKNSMKRVFPTNKMRKVMQQMGQKMSKEEAKKKIAIWWRFLIPRRRLLDRMFKVNLAHEILDDIINRAHIKSIQLIKYRIWMLRNGAARIIQKFSRDYVKYRILKRITMKKALSREIAWYLLDRWAISILASIRVWRYIIKVKLKIARRNLALSNPPTDPKKVIKSKDIKKKRPLKDIVNLYFSYIQFVPAVSNVSYLKQLRKKFAKFLKPVVVKKVAAHNSTMINSMALSPSRRSAASSSQDMFQKLGSKRNLTPVVLVQSVIRMYLGKRRWRRRKVMTYIYFKVLAFMSRSKIKRIIRNKKMKDEKAIMIQKNVRCFLGRRLTYRIVHATLVIIRSWKRYAAMSVLKGRLRRVDRPYTLVLNNLINISESALGEGNRFIFAKVSVFWNPLLHIVKGNDYMTVVDLKQPQVRKKSPKFETTGTAIYAKMVVSEHENGHQIANDAGDDEDFNDDDNSGGGDAKEEEIDESSGGKLDALAIIDKLRNEKLEKAAAMNKPVLPIVKLSSTPALSGFSRMTHRLSQVISTNLRLPVFIRGNPKSLEGRPLRKCDFKDYSVFIPGCHGKSVFKIEIFKAAYGLGDEDESIYTWYVNIGESGNLLYWGGEFTLPLPDRSKRLNYLKTMKPQGGPKAILSAKRRGGSLSSSFIAPLGLDSVDNNYNDKPTIKLKIVAAPAMLSNCGWAYVYMGSKEGPLKQQLCKKYSMLRFVSIWKKLYLSISEDFIFFYDHRYRLDEFAKWNVHKINKCDIKTGQSLANYIGLDVNPRKEDLCNLEVSSSENDLIIFRFLTASDRVQWIDVFQNIVRRNEDL